MRKITASKSALLLGPCVRWAHPAARWFEDRPEDAEKREDGKDIHKAIQLYDHGLPYSVRPELQPKVSFATEFLDQLKERSQWVKTEQALGINWKTGEVDGPYEAGDRDYPDNDIYHYGTADIVALLRGGSLLIADWKTGGSGGVEAQLLTLACGGVRIFTTENGSFRPVRIAPLYVTEDGVVSHEREVAASELSAHQDSMANALDRARAAPKPSLPIVGPQCTELFCPHLAYCPQTEKEAENAVAAVPEDVLVSGWTRDVESTNDAGQKALRLGAIKRAVKFHEGKIKDWVNAGNRAEWDGYCYEDRGSGFRRYRVNPG